MTRDEMREKVARGICLTFDPTGDTWEEWAEEADAALAAIESTGHRIVPVEPTEEMVEAGISDVGWTDDADDKKDMASAYRAMLTAYGQKGES